MPVKRARDKFGNVGYRWGNHGKIYRYKVGNKISREAARKKAIRQGISIKISQKRSK